MPKESLTVRVDPALKAAAQRVADHLGVSLGAVITNELARLVAEGHVLVHRPT